MKTIFRIGVLSLLFFIFYTTSVIIICRFFIPFVGMGIILTIFSFPLSYLFFLAFAILTSFKYEKWFKGNHVFIFIFLSVVFGFIEAVLIGYYGLKLFPKIEQAILQSDTDLTLWGPIIFLPLGVITSLIGKKYFDRYF